MTREYWLYFEENYVQEDLENEKKQVKKNDGKTSNDGNASKIYINWWADYLEEYDKSSL